MLKLMPQAPQNTTNKSKEQAGKQENEENKVNEAKGSQWEPSIKGSNKKKKYDNPRIP
mgnify:CR=1 FL=1